MATFDHLAVDSRHFWVDHLEVISCVPANLELRLCYCYLKWELLGGIGLDHSKSRPFFVLVKLRHLRSCLGDFDIKGKIRHLDLRSPFYPLNLLV